MEDPLGIRNPNSADPALDFRLVRRELSEGTTPGLGDLRDRLIRRLRYLIANGQATERGLARSIGVSQPHLHNALKGKRRMSVELADSILRNLRLGVYDLLDESWQNQADRELAAYAEEQRRISEQCHRLLPRHMLNGFAHCKMLYDGRNRPVDFVTLEVNPAFEQITGLREVVGKPVSQVIPGILEAMPEFFEIQGRVAWTGEPEKFEVDFRQINRRLSVSVYSPEKSYFVAVFADITDGKQYK